MKIAHYFIERRGGSKLTIINDSGVIRRAVNPSQELKDITFHGD